MNVLAHIIGRSYETILREFEGEKAIEAVTSDAEGGTGDVKYHHGAEGVRKTSSGDVRVGLAANPSHLEYVDPVVEGETRALQTDHQSATDVHDPTAALAILIHGDAAFPGQGVVAETLNLQGLPGYDGALHLIANNQIGFTTDPDDGRSTRYSSDLAKGFDAPIIHVNADDAEGAIAAIRLAMAFRERFRHDIVVDLVGYRRFGHNEGDEPAYTQPLMYETIEAIRRSPAVRGPARRGRHAERGRRREARRRRAKGHARRARGAQGGDRGGNVVDTEGAPPGSRRRLASSTPRCRRTGCAISTRS